MALINKQKAIDEIRDFQSQVTCSFSKEWENGMDEGFDHAIAVIELMETEDAEPVRHGKWIGYPKCLKYENALTDDDYACSCCGEVFNCISNDMERFDYCPHCGAKMDANGMLLAEEILQHLAEELGKALSEIAERVADAFNEYFKSEDDDDRKID